QGRKGISNTLKEQSLAYGRPRPTPPSSHGHLAAAEMLSYDQLMRSCDTNSSRIHQSELG
ncbi:MAG TPA: hypothetical protein VN857_19550, partial [Chthoniobacterales bacterium]|nr:hypothetical protein [Chthoniobacterales bacterium]